MLNAAETLSMMLAAAALRRTKNPSNVALADELDGHLAATAAAKAAMAAGGAKSKRADGRGRPPSVYYIVELDPRWRTRCLGLKEAHTLATETLTELGMPELLPSLAGMTVTQARSGAWWTNVETTDGTLCLSIRRDRDQTPHEPESGTDPA